MPISDPTDIAGCQLWLDADDSGTITLSGAQITQWDDKSGNGNDFVPVAGGVGPDYVAAILNGKAVAEFDGINDGLRNLSLIVAQPFTVFVVMMTNDPTSTGAVLRGPTSDPCLGLHPVNGGSMFVGDGTNFPSNTFLLTASAPFYMTTVHDGANSDARLDGVAQFTNLNIGSNGTPSGTHIGRSAAFADSLGNSPGSFIAEFIIYDSALGSTDIDDVEDYLVAKWFTGPGGGVDIFGTLTTALIKTSTVDGTITPAGSESELTSKLLAGGVTPAGTDVEQAAKLLGGTITPAGTESEQTSKLLAGGVTPSGALVADLIEGGNVTDQSVDGTIVPTGTESELTLKSLVGGITPSGTLSKSVTRTLAGNVTPSGTENELTSKTTSGVVGPSGELDQTQTQTLEGTIGSSGTLSKRVSKVTSGGITPSGDTDPAFLDVVDLSGSIGSSGNLDVVVTKALSGSVTPTGADSELILKTLVGGVTPNGQLETQTGSEVSVSGVIPSVGDLVLLVLKGVGGGSVVPQGDETRLVGKTTSGTVGSSGTLDTDASVSLALGGAIVPAGNLAKRVGKLLVGVITSDGTLVEVFVPFVPDVHNGTARATVSTSRRVSTATATVGRGTAIARVL